MHKLLGGLLLLAGTSLAALEVEVEVPVSNIYLSPERNPDAPGLKFTGEDFFWSSNFLITQNLSDTLKFRGGYLSETPLRKRAFLEAQIKTDNLTLSVGPIYGLLNSKERLFIPGLSADVRVDLPGFAFLDIGFLATLFPMARPGDYAMTSQRATVGFFPLPSNGIVTLSAQYSEFLEQKTADSSIQDSLLKFTLGTEVFVKNFPLRFQVNFNYQILERSYFNVDLASVKHNESTPVHSFLVGLKTTFETNSNLAFYLNGDMSLFSFGLKDTNYNVAEWLPLFNASVGIKFSLDGVQAADTSSPLPVPEPQKDPEPQEVPLEGL